MLVIAGCSPSPPPSGTPTYAIASLWSRPPARTAAVWTSPSPPTPSTRAGSMSTSAGTTKADLLAFRGSGPDQDQTAQILDANVKRYVISDITDP